MRERERESKRECVRERGRESVGEREKVRESERVEYGQIQIDANYLQFDYFSVSELPVIDWLLVFQRMSQGQGAER